MAIDAVKMGERFPVLTFVTVPPPITLMAFWTKAVVASWVVLVAFGAVGAVGTPVRAGEAENTTFVVPVVPDTVVP